MCQATEPLEGLASGLSGPRESSKKSGVLRRSSHMIKKSSSIRESENERTDTSQQRLDKLHQTKGEIDVAFNRIRFTAEFFAYSTRRFWPMFDLFASSHHMLMQFVILVAAIYWWLNLVSILLITCFAIFCISITRKLNVLKQEAKLDRMLEDTKIIKLRDSFAERVRNITLDGRFAMWNMQFLLVTLALIIIYPSEFLLYFETSG